jgi:RNA polymerase sigma factor (sigma-70 family)
LGPKAKGEVREHFRGWLFKVANNLLTDRQRRKRTLSTALEVLVIRRGHKQSRSAVQDQWNDLLAQCLEKLRHFDPQLERAILLRFDVEGYGAIMQELDVTKVEAYRLVFEARKHLQACVQRGQP